MFLAAVAACGVELTQVIGRERGVEVAGVSADITAALDRSSPVRDDATVFNAVRLRFAFRGVAEDVAHDLVEGFKARCPLFGTVATAVPDVDVEWTCAA
jgi:uncharacterized OsmC-like protein